MFCLAWALVGVQNALALADLELSILLFVALHRIRGELRRGFCPLKDRARASFAPEELFASGRRLVPSFVGPSGA